MKIIEITFNVYVCKTDVNVLLCYVIAYFEICEKIHVHRNSRLFSESTFHDFLKTTRL